MSTQQLLENLQNPELYDYPITGFTLLETHCSYVLLTGKYAYKIKKPVDFGFLNYSDLTKRQHFCEEEVKRNQAMAGEIYLETVPIYGGTTEPSFTATSKPIEYAVKMREFCQDNLLSQLQQQQQLTPEIVAQLAENLANFHLQAPLVPMDNVIGSSAHAHQQSLDNFSQTIPLLTDENDIVELQQLQHAVDEHYQQIKTIIDRRKQQGFVRQCHGDVHLNNIVLIDNNPVIFDCIDFNDDFCWTDTMADLAFITMDLDEFGEHTLSWLLLNRYLEITGDYDGLQVLAYFQSYRAMVRAKVAMFTLIHSQSATEKKQQYTRYKGCVTLAKQYLNKKPRHLLITCGISASGKSTIAKALSVKLDLIHLSSDRERKRQAGLALRQDCTAPVLSGIYHDSITEKTYAALGKLAQTVLDAGYPVLVDATFREKKYRTVFANIAQGNNIPFTILYCEAPEAQLRTRLNVRQQSANNISEATQEVITMQLATFETPLNDEENAQTLKINTAESISFDTIVKQIGLESLTKG
jgi:aminoglycoside phosphotransferase family enzyme/predicted kinase